MGKVNQNKFTFTQPRCAKAGKQQSTQKLPSVPFGRGFSFFLLLNATKGAEANQNQRGKAKAARET